jgi:hypothetical protein
MLRLPTPEGFRPPERSAMAAVFLCDHLRPVDNGAVFAARGREGGV